MQLTALLLFFSCTSQAPSSDAPPAPGPPAAADEAPPASPGLPGQLAWIAEASGGPRVWIRADANARELVGPEGLTGATFPAAPDPLGTHQVVVRSTEDPHEESLWLVPLAGDGPPVALGFAAPIVRNPSWSPDGAFVVFESNRDSFRDLYRVERTGGEAKRLTAHDNGSFEPAVGPEGRIAYVSSQTGDAEIWTMAADGADPTQITDRPGDDTRPGWVDGRLVWLARTGMMVELWRQGVDGSHAPVRQTARERLAASPPVEPPRRIAREWAASPDGERFAVTVQTGPADIALDVLDGEGALVKRLDGPRTDENPTWSPDSQWLAFSGHLDDQAEPDLYVVDRNGEGATRITTDPGPDWLPRWTK